MIAVASVSSRRPTNTAPQRAAPQGAPSQSGNGSEPGQKRERFAHLLMGRTYSRSDVIDIALSPLDRGDRIRSRTAANGAGRLRFFGVPDRREDLRHVSRVLHRVLRRQREEPAHGERTTPPARAPGRGALPLSAGGRVKTTPAAQLPLPGTAGFDGGPGDISRLLNDGSQCTVMDPSPNDRTTQWSPLDTGQIVPS